MLRARVSDAGPQRLGAPASASSDGVGGVAARRPARAARRRMRSSSSSESMANHRPLRAAKGRRRTRAHAAALRRRPLRGGGGGTCDDGDDDDDECAAPAPPQEVERQSSRVVGDLGPGRRHHARHELRVDLRHRGDGLLRRRRVLRRRLRVVGVQSGITPPRPARERSGAAATSYDERVRRDELYQAPRISPGSRRADLLAAHPRPTTAALADDGVPSSLVADSRRGAIHACSYFHGWDNDTHDFDAFDVVGTAYVTTTHRRVRYGSGLAARSDAVRRDVVTAARRSRVDAEDRHGGGGHSVVAALRRGPEPQRDRRPARTGRLRRGHGRLATSATPATGAAAGRARPSARQHASRRPSRR